MDKTFLDPDHPLMERFKVLAPASVKHCQNVASMCDAVANELPDIDKEKLHLAATYHDVGKLLCPRFFSENQDDEKNPHDDLSPKISYELITRHVGDSAALLAQHRFPYEVIDIVLEHHGNSVVKAFANKAKGEDDENYRYKWNPPSTIEAAILMVCDVCEAKAKSLSQSGKLGDPGELVDGVITDLNDDDQVDILNFGVSKVLSKVLTRELQSLYHKRVDYPDKDEKSVD